MRNATMLSRAIAAAGVLALAPFLPCYAGDGPKAVTTETNKPRAARLHTAVIQVAYDKNHPSGSTIDTGEIKEIYKKDGVQGVFKRLGTEGKVTLLTRAESETAIPAPGAQFTTKTFFGDEQSFLTKKESNEEGKKSASQSQVSLSSGIDVDVDFKSDPESGTNIAYKVSFDYHFPRHQDAGELSQSVRISIVNQVAWEPGSVVVERQTRNLLDGPSEFLFLLDIAEAKPS